ncbi:hypothetical protein O6H91_Y049400 [Diphasiastrum complanatum]|nr:hypothetical protein O6H91_Y049400 [Diphasiastrum complanatum]
MSACFLFLIYVAIFGQVRDQSIDKWNLHMKILYILLFTYFVSMAALDRADNIMPSFTPTVINILFNLGILVHVLVVCKVSR